MIGAGVLILALVVVGPMILDGGPSQPVEVSPPPGQRGDELRTHTFHLDKPEAVEPAGSAAAVPATGGAEVPAETPQKQTGIGAGRAQLPAVAAAPAPAPRVSAPPVSAQPVPAVRTAKAGEGEPAGAQKDSQDWVVQVGTFGQKGNADRLSARLRDQGFEAFVSPTRSGARTLYRVRVGPAGSREAVGRLAKRLAAAGHEGQVVSR